MLTGERRLATVTAQTDVKTLAIGRSTLMPKFGEDPVLASLIYRNVLFMERSKLIASNQRIAQLLQDVADGDEYAASEDEDAEVEEGDSKAEGDDDAAEDSEAG